MNNKLGTVVKRAVVFAMAMAISTGMLTACTGGKKQDNIKRDPSAQIQQKDKKSTDETAKPPKQTIIQGTENDNAPVIEAGKGTVPEVESKDTGKNTPAVEENDADKNTPTDVNKEADKNIPAKENGDTAGTEQNDTPAADLDKKVAEGENKDTVEAEQKEADAEKTTEGKEQKNDKKQTDTKTSAVDGGKK